MSNLSKTYFKIILAILTVFIVLLSGCIEPNTSDTEKAILTIVKEDGSLVNVTKTMLFDLTFVKGNSSYENRLGNIFGGTYKGVKVQELLDNFEISLESGDTIVAHSTDGYKAVYPYENIYTSTEYYDYQGNLVVAYEYNDTIVPDWEDGLQMIFMTEDGLYSNEDKEKTSSFEIQGSAGSRWIKNIDKIEIRCKEGRVQFVGESSYNLSKSQIEFLPTIEGIGSFLKTTGAVSGPYNYTGVDVVDTLSLLTNTSEDFAIEVEAIDGYKMTFSKNQVFGKVPMYNTTGDEIGIGTYGVNNTLILAYEQDGKALGEDIGGPFRMVYVGDDETCITDGHFWAKFVKSITITAGMPEWSINLNGISQTSIGLDDFDSVVYCKDQVHYEEIVYTEESGKVVTYEGFPLYIALSMIDGELSGQSHNTFNMSLAEGGYQIKIFSKSGESIILNSSEVINQSQTIILSHIKNGIPLPEDEFPVRLVSKELPEEMWISQIIAISIINVPSMDLVTPSEMEWEITLANELDETSYTLTGESYYTIWNLCSHHRKTINVAEDDGSTSIYEGIPLYVFIAIIDGGEDDTHYGGFDYTFNEALATSGYTIRVIAEDGYFYDFSSSEVALNSSIILAFKINGAFLDPSKAPLRVIPDGMEGKSRVGSIAEIKIIPG